MSKRHEPPHQCLRCGVPSQGRICRDCRETDPAWFALAGIYHQASNRTGARIDRRAAQ